MVELFTVGDGLRDDPACSSDGFMGGRRMIRSVGRLCALVGGLALISGGVGCSISGSISNSSESISDSSGSISDSSKSSSDSSGSSSDGNDVAYREDITSYTVAFLEANPVDSVEAGSFTRLLRHIAEAHGISDWEGSAATFYAIGSGLQRAGVSDAEALSFSERVLGTSEREAQLMMHGFWESEDLS